MVTSDKRFDLDDPPELTEADAADDSPSSPEDGRKPATDTADQPPDEATEKAPEAGARKDARKPGRVAELPKRATKREILKRLADKTELILQLTKKNVELDKQRKDLYDKVLRSQAEFENYRKRSQKEWELLRQQTKAEVILEILNVVDDFERAFLVVGESEDNFVQGIRLIHSNMLSILEHFGVEKMNALNAPFDPNYHVAVAHIESDDAPSNHVVEVIQHGYLVDGAVLRPAKVVIAK